MPTYKYTATDPFDTTITGVYEATTAREVEIYLRRSGLTPVVIKRSWLRSDIQLGGSRVKTRDLIVFTRMFGAMARAAVPMNQALNILHRQTENRALKRAVQRIIVDVETGQALSEAMKNQSSVFDSLYVNMIAVGEQSGNLDQMLERLAQLLERTEAIRAKVKGAMIYPAVLLAVALVVVFLMMMFVVPTFIEMFDSTGVPLPMITQLVVNIAAFFKDQWWLVLAGIAGFGMVVSRLRDNESVKRLMDRLLIRVKVIGPILQKGAIARFTRTLATLIHSGVGITDGLELTAETAGNVVISEAILNARTAISTGSDIAEPLRRSGVFPPLVTSMIAIGQQSGELDDMLSKIADFYEDDVNRAIDGALKLIEPMMLIVMGGLVGGILAALYLPLFDMISTLGTD